MSSQLEPPIAKSPNEMILQTSRYLDRRSLGRFSQTCKDINSLLYTALTKAAKADSLRLPHAIKKGQTTAVKGYLKAGVDPNYCTGSSGERMLNIASKKSQYDVMCVLLAHGADASLSDASAPRIPLRHAIRANDHLVKDIMMQQLLTAGADTSQQRTIHEIARYCNLDTLKLAKLCGADYYQCDTSGSSILECILSGYIRIRNCDHYNGCDTYGLSIMGDDLDKLNYILHEASDLISVVNRNNETPLFTAIRVGDQNFACSLHDVYYKCYTRLLAIRNRNRETVLHLSIFYGMERLFMIFIKSGITLHNVRDLDKRLRYVVKSYSVPILRHLIEADADVDCHIRYWGTPLKCAMSDYKFAFVLVLVEIGNADLSLTGIEGEDRFVDTTKYECDTPLQLPERYGRNRIAQYLRSRGDE